MAAIRHAQVFEKEKENVRAGKGGFGKVSARPRVALGDHTNRSLKNDDDKVFGDAKKTLTRARGTSVLAPQVTKNAEVPSIDMQDLSEALAECAIPSGVKDIDKDDFHIPQLCSEYINDIMRYMRALERKFSVSPDYMDKQPIVTEKMRIILIDWLIQVHSRFTLLQETLYITISIIDRYLSHYEISKEKLQLLGVSAMLLASKYEEMYSPEIEDFAFITDHAYTKTEIRKMEALIFKRLDFSLGMPLCLHFLRRNSKAAEVSPEKHTVAKYLMEVTLLDYVCVQFLPSEIAAAALCLSLKLCDNSKWTPTLEYYSTYTEAQLSPCMQRIAQLLLNKEYIIVGKDKVKAKAVYSKYSHGKFMRVSLLPCLKSSSKIIQDLASGESS